MFIIKQYKGRDNISIFTMSLKLINQPGQTWIICLKTRTRLIITEAPLVCNLSASFVQASAQCQSQASSEIQNFLCPEKILPFESQTNKGVIRQNNFKISQRTERFQISNTRDFVSEALLFCPLLSSTGDIKFI